LALAISYLKSITLDGKIGVVFRTISNFFPGFEQFQLSSKQALAKVWRSETNSILHLSLEQKIHFVTFSTF
jgi:hypothetical protein